MRHRFRTLMGLLLLSAGLKCAAQLVTVHTHGSSDAITSFDRDSGGTLYYQTATPSFRFGGLHSWNGSVQTTLVSGNTDFPGASVVHVGDHIYYNTEDFTNQKIHRFGALSGMPASQQISANPNWGLFARGAEELFITGAPGFGTNQMYHATLDGSGNISGIQSLGVTSGAPGPVAFDASGNLFYAPGFSDTKIYRYTASELADAIADPLNAPLPAAADRIWRDYGADFTVSGATGMVFDDEGSLWLTLTDFVNPSLLVRMALGGGGSYLSHDILLSTTNRLGSLRNFDGEIHMAMNNTIVAVPEPSTLLLVLVCGVASMMFLRRNRSSGFQP